MLPAIDLPKPYQDNLDRAVTILKNGGCTEGYLFGSLATGRFNTRSAIDLAVRGCPSGQFFHLLGKPLMTLDYPVDMVDLDSDDPFVHFLIQKGKSQKIA